LRPVAALVVDPAVIWLSVLNAIACTFAPVLMVMMAVERVGAAMAAQAGTIGPVATILMAAVILGERITGWALVGTILVLVGIWLLTRPAGRVAGRGA
jgi:drug/metabolite transporter (DMT)-like permease